MRPTGRSSILAGLIGSVMLLVLAAQAGAAPKLDYGDAPDGAGAGYEVAVIGKFPSLLASSGPRHKSSGPSLGIRRDREPDSKQVDRDRFDDGVSLGRLGVCKTSRITVLIDTRRIPKKLLRRKDLYLNTWFDWNRSGTWGETNGCPNVNPLLNNEWAIVNQKIRGKAFLKERVRAFSYRFASGLHSNEFWMRATLTLGQKLPINAASRSGGATGKTYAYGETEDYLVQAHPGLPPIFPDPSGKPNKKSEEEEEKRKEEKEKEKEEKEKPVGGPFKVSCIPNPMFMEHGKTGVVRFSLKDEGKGPIYGKRASPKSTNSYRSRILRHPNQRGVPAGYFRAAGFKVKSTKRDARANPIEVRVFKFRFQRAKTKQLLKCVVVIVHEKLVKPKKPHKPAKVPPAQLPSQPQPQPQPQPRPTTGGEEQKPLNGQGFYEFGGSNQFAIRVMFDQDVDGFRLRLTGSGPPFEFTNAFTEPSAPCKANTTEDPSHKSVLCEGTISAGENAVIGVQFDTEPGPGGLGEQLELSGIQGGTEQGHFPVQLQI